MTALLEGLRASADGSIAILEDVDNVEASSAAATSVTRVPLHGPCDATDIMCAKVLFALCGSVFPHPLLLAQQLLGIEDQDFPEFQLNVAEAGNNCIDIVAAYLTNLRVMQLEEEPNPPVSLAMVQPRHAATVASVAAKARDLMCELALARATVKPRKAPKNKAIESAARAAAAAASAPSSGPPSLASAATTASDTLFGSAEGDSSNGGEDADIPSDTGLACSEETSGSDSNDDSSSWAMGHQDTSRDDATPRTAREEEERLLYALQGASAAEETLKMVRARPSGCKSPAPVGGDTGRSSSTGESTLRGSNGSSAPSQPAAAAGGSGNAMAASSPRSAAPPPPPTRPASLMASGGAAGSAGSSGMGSRSGQEGGRGAGRGAGVALSSTGLQGAASCPVTGLPESVIPTLGPAGNAGAPLPQAHGGGHRRSGVPLQPAGGGNGGGARRGGGMGSTRASPTPPAASAQQQLQQQQQQLAVAQLLGLRNAYPCSSLQGLMALQGAYGSNSGGGVSPFGAASSGRLDYNSGLNGLNGLNLNGLNNLGSVAATTAALELAAAQQAAAFNAAAAANGMAAHLGYGTAAGGAAGFGGQPGGASMQQSFGSLATHFGSAPGSLAGLGGATLLQSQQQQQQAAVAAAALFQQGGGMAPSQVGGGAADAWNSMLLQAQLGSLA